jgi:hypothetical protein
MDEVLTERPFTVFGFWHETWERFAWQVMAPNPDMAEELTHLEARNRGGHLGICGVVDGFIDVVDTHLWVDPSVTSQEQMDALRQETGYMP